MTVIIWFLSSILFLAASTICIKIYKYWRWNIGLEKSITKDLQLISLLIQNRFSKVSNKYSELLKMLNIKNRDLSKNEVDRFKRIIEEISWRDVSDSIIWNEELREISKKSFFIKIYKVNNSIQNSENWIWINMNLREDNIKYIRNGKTYTWENYDNLMKYDLRLLNEEIYFINNVLFPQNIKIFPEFKYIRRNIHFLKSSFNYMKVKKIKKVLVKVCKKNETIKNSYISNREIFDEIIRNKIKIILRLEEIREIRV